MLLTDSELRARFEDTSLPYDRWDHMSHVRVAFLYLSRHTFPDAVKRMRIGIKQYNDAHRPEVRVGYHETITVVFLVLIKERMGEEGDSGSLSFCDGNPDLLDPRILERYYSRELLFSEAARAGFVEPDREPLSSELTGQVLCDLSQE